LPASHRGGPGFDSRSVHVGFVVDKVTLEQVPPPPPEFFGFPLSILFHRCSITRKRTKIIIFIFIIGLHNKPQGCSASVASAAGPFTTRKKKVLQFPRLAIGCACNLWLRVSTVFAEVLAGWEAVIGLNPPHAFKHDLWGRA
jgi:hypothetical protein